MFGLDSPDGYQEVVPGIRIKTLVSGEKALMTKFLLSAGSKLPDHSHPHEQIGTLVSGRMRLTIGERSREVKAGDSWCVPLDAPHHADIIEDSVAVEVFSPLREDYLKYQNKADLAE